MPLIGNNSHHSKLGFMRQRIKPVGEVGFRACSSVLKILVVQSKTKVSARGEWKVEGQAGRAHLPWADYLRNAGLKLQLAVVTGCNI